MPNHNAAIILFDGRDAAYLHVDWPLPHQKALLTCRTCKYGGISCQHVKTVSTFIEDDNDDYAAQLADIAFQLHNKMDVISYCVPTSFSQHPIPFFACDPPVDIFHDDDISLLPTTTRCSACHSEGGTMSPHQSAKIFTLEGMRDCTSKLRVY